MTTAASNVRPVRIEEEMRSAYLDYAMSVIVARALPDVRDGLKPVQRRILYAMHELGLRPNSAYKKCARIVGEVLGKYHPHGDAPVYDALVRMAQDFTMRYPLVDGQGNFGSIDNDPPAAMRYTEARLATIAQEMLVDIEKETVAFAPNFDSSLEEPLVLPAQLPNLLVNGAAGIAVGMATSIPPHNLSEVCDGIVHLIDHPEATVDELVPFVKGPDFPTGAIIMGRSGIQNAYATGHGRVLVRARADIVEEQKNRKSIVVTEVPYQINKAALVEKIAELVKEKRVDGISEVRDESDREGMRIVVELKREAQPERVLNNLYKHTAMQSAFFINMLALVDGTPRVLNLRQLLQHYVDFRQEVVRKRSEYELRKARERAHILEGLLKALDKIDAVIRTIRESADVDVARANLMQRFDLTQVQAQAILDMQLRRLAALEWRKIQDEYAELRKTIAELEALLADPKKIMAKVREEVIQLEKDYGDKRRTEITEEEVKEFRFEDLIPHQDVVVTLSNRGYIKRLPITTFRLQHRGGRGIVGTVAREQDVIQHLEVADTHDMVLFFTNRGRVFRLKCFEIPAEFSRTAKGVPLVNMIKLDEQERVTAVIAVPPEEIPEGVQKEAVEAPGSEAPAGETPPAAEPEEAAPGERCILFCTRRGEIKRSPLSRFRNIRGSGLIAMDLEKGDELVSVKLAKPDDQVIIVTERGQSIRFAALDVRARSRYAGGIRGMRLQPEDRVVAMDIIQPDSYLFTVSLNGYGKLTSLNRYRSQKRGGKGIRTFKVTDKTGLVATGLVVLSGHDIMLISEKGIVIRTTLDEISVQGRITQGVTVMKLEPGDVVASVAYINNRASTQEPPPGGKRGRAKDSAASAESEDEPDPDTDEEAPSDKERPPPKAKGRKGAPKASSAKAAQKGAPKGAGPRAARSARPPPRGKTQGKTPQGKSKTGVAKPRGAKPSPQTKK
ncbi:MAG: DNA gyrase subunit A [Chloroflexi bacterium]|nr:DNA gyrase subunit A [Chloroflexota bacterium]